MRIAYLSPLHLIKPAGGELHARRLAEELAARGHQVAILVGRPEQAATFFARSKGTGPRVEVLPRLGRAEKLLALGLQLENVRGGYRLMQWLRRSGYLDLLAKGPYCPAIGKPETYASFDVSVLVNFNTSWEILYARAARRRQDRVMIGMPLFHVREPPASWPVHLRYRRCFTHIVANTEFERQFLMAKGWDGSRITAIGVGSDEYPGVVQPGSFRNRHGIPADAPLILFVGRKIYNKGVPHLIQAMDRVWERIPECRLVLLGFSHNPREWVEGYVQSCRYPDAAQRVLNIDDVPQQTLEEALEDCTVMALPSISDSFGIAYLDAWRHRKPVIGCRQTCAESVIEDGVDGCLVEFGDVRGLGEAILSMLGQADGARRMGERGFEKWKRMYQWHIIAEKTERIYRQLLEDTGPARQQIT